MTKTEEILSKSFYLATLLSIFFPLLGWAQKNKEVFQLHKDTHIGRLANSDKMINADCFVFSNKPMFMSIDPQTDISFIWFEDKGFACNLDSTAFLYDLKELGYVFYQSNAQSFIIANTNGINAASNCYSLIDGKKKWGAKFFSSSAFFPLREDPKSNIIVGIDNYEVKGLNAEDGQVVWKRKLENRDAGIPYPFQLNDSTILIATGGIHSVNLSTGEGWSYKVKTGNKSLNKARNQQALLSGLGGLGGALGGLAGGALMGAMGQGIGMTIGVATTNTIIHLSNDNNPLPYGRLDIAENTATFASEVDSVTLNLADGQAIEHIELIKDKKKRKKEEKTEYIFNFSYKDLEFKQKEKVLEVFNKEEKKADIRLEQLLYVKDDYIYTNIGSNLYRIDIKQFN